MRKKSIPDEIREKAIEIVEAFNQSQLSGSAGQYLIRFKGKFLYLDRYSYPRTSPICRLKYNGTLDDWDFAIFKWSSETYDPDEWFFPGSQFVDGSIEGAMKAGLQAYPE